MTDTDDFRTTMDELAAALAKTAGDVDKDFKDRIDAFKALTAYAAFRMKHPNGPDDDADTFNFEQEIHGNGSKIPS